MGKYTSRADWAIFLIQSNSGEPLLINIDMHDMLPKDRFWFSYEGLSYPIKYANGHPESHWICFEKPLHEEEPLKIINGTIVGVVRIRHLLRVRLSFEIETPYGKETVVEENFLPLRYGPLCKKLKREKRSVPIKLYAYTYNKALRIDESIPHSENLPSRTPTLVYIPHHVHPWIACVSLDKYLQQFK